MNYKIAGLIIFSLLVADLAYSQTFVGTFVTVNGDVKVLKKATSKSAGVPLARFQGKDYTYQKAKIGRKIKARQVVQTGPNGKAKVVYSNGDHFTVGPGTHLVMPSPGKGNKKTGKSNLKLIYGKMRSMVSKKGPRRNLDVKTPSAVAGVRGTDFFVNHSTGETKLTVIRGEVEVKKVVKEKVVSKPVKVKTGFTAKVEEAPKPEAIDMKQPKVVQKKITKKVELVKATKEDLLEVQTASTVKAIDVDIQNIADSVKKEIKVLEKKSTEAVLTDIKEEDPKLFEEIQKSEEVAKKDAAKISTVVVSKLFKKAPKAKVKLKPTEKEIEQMGEDIYEKYFKVE